MKVGDYGRTEEGEIIKIEELEDIYTGLNEFITTIAYFKGGYISVEHIIKSSPNITKLLKPMDLLYIDISPDDCGGIIVPRIPETLNELNNYIKKIKSGELILKGVVTREQLMERMFEVK